MHLLTHISDVKHDTMGIFRTAGEERTSEDQVVIIIIVENVTSLKHMFYTFKTSFLDQEASPGAEAEGCNLGRPTSASCFMACSVVWRGKDSDAEKLQTGQYYTGPSHPWVMAAALMGAC